MADIFDELVRNYGPIGQYRSRAHGYFAFPKLEGAAGAHMKFRGKEVIVWSLNNYLGLANHPEILKADADSSAAYGLALPMGSRMMSGNSTLHETLESRLAHFEKKQDALLMNYGYQGIMSALDAILSRHDVVVYDAQCHACIIDGLRLFPGKRFQYRHNDPAQCLVQLRRANALIKQQSEGGILVITEGVFGMSGDQGRLREIVELKKIIPFRLLIDDAHGFGTMGASGAGTSEAQECMDGVDLYFATFAKSMASIGAFMAGPRIIIDYIRYNIRSQIFAKSLPFAFVEGNLKRLDLLEHRPELRERLWHNARKLQEGLRREGFNLGNTNTMVTPVYMKGGVAEATMMVMYLREHYGIFCSIVVYPVIPKDEILFRLIPTAAHSEQDIDNTIKAFAETKKKLDRGDFRCEQIPDMADPDTMPIGYLSKEISHS